MAARTSSSPARIEASLTMGLTAVTSEAPLSVWPGAGEGHVRPYLLRAYPLLSDDSITGPAFGRGLAHLSAEVGVRALSLGPSSFGTATFLDLAQPWSQPNSTAWGPGLASFGCGVRLRLPGFAGALRADVAWSGSRGKPVFSLAWREGWPGLPAAIR